MFDKTNVELDYLIKDAEVFFVNNLDTLKQNDDSLEPKSIRSLYKWCKNFIVDNDDQKQQVSQIRQVENYED